MSKVTISDIAQILASKKGARPTTIIAHTIPEFVGGKSCTLLKAGPITKVQITNGICNFLYENSVNNQREREEQPTTESGAVEIFNAEHRKWGCRLLLGKFLLPFVHHVHGLVQPDFRDIKTILNLPPSNELYLELKCQDVGLVKYIQAGKELDYDTVKKHLRQKTEGARQQVDNPVVLRDYKLINLRQITLDGKVYELEEIGS